MGTFNFVITYPDAQQARILNALKTNWTRNGVVPTNAEVVEQLRQTIISHLKDIVLGVEITAARNAINPVDAT